MDTQKHKQKGTLRDTFILFFIVISCTPLLVLGGVSLVSITNSHKQNISELEHQTLTSTQIEASLFFENILETLSTNFDTLDETSLSKTDALWQETYAKKFLDDNKAFLEVSFVNPQGKEVAKASRIDKHINLLYLSELPMFKDALSGKTSISDIHRTEHGQSITVAVPSVVNGKVINVVMAEVDISPLADILNKTQLGSSGYVLMFDTRGTIVDSIHTTKIAGVNFSTWEPFSRLLKGDPFNGLSVKDRYISIISNIPVVASGLRIPNTSWNIIVEWPISESDLLIENFRNKILLAIFISFIIVIIIASLLAIRLIKPIRKLEQAAHEIEQGNFISKVDIQTDNELEELADSFNTMAVGLKRLEDLKNELVYVAAHELRAPVTAIKGYMELIFGGSAGPLTPEMERFLTPVKKSNDRLVTLIHDLLRVAQSEAGKLEITVSPSDIRGEIQAILDEVKPLALERNITVTYDSAQELPNVDINAGSFKEIIMNFVSNAIKYGNDNGTLTISHEVRGEMVATILADNGRGISQEDQQHLFTKFFRAGDVKKTKIEGTGLGLFITKELIEKMGGTIGVTSELGKGTTFTVCFVKSKEPSSSSVTA